MESESGPRNDAHFDITHRRSGSLKSGYVNPGLNTGRRLAVKRRKVAGPLQRGQNGALGSGLRRNRGANVGKGFQESCSESERHARSAVQEAAITDLHETGGQCVLQRSSDEL